MPAPYRRLGRIVKAHSTNGEVAVESTGDLAFVSQNAADVWIVPPLEAGAVPRRIESVRRGPKHSLVRISGMDTAAEAHEAVGRWLLVGGDEVVSVDEPDEFLGLRVRDRERGELGVVTDVIVTGANDVLVIEGERYGQVLIPVIDDVIVGVDLTAGTVDVTLLDGLIDEEAG